MFADQWWPNLVLFAAGQAAAWYYLHTGRTRIGTVATVALWVLADWFLVARFVFRVTAADAALPLVALQLVAASTVVALLIGWWRRRRSATARRRGELFTAGLVAYLRLDHAAAESIFRRLVRNDPWDAAAWVALGNVLARAARPRRARRCYGRALGVDVGNQYRDLVRHQLALLDGAGAPASPVPSSVVLAETAPTG